MKLLNVEAVKQLPSFCGPASLSMVFKYWNKEHSFSQAELAKQAHTSLDDGTSAPMMVRVAKRHGYAAKVVNTMSYASLMKAINEGVPVIVNWFSVNQSHYSVIVGCTATSIAMQDPFMGRKRVISRKLFESVWFAYEPEGQRPRHAQNLHIQRAIVIRPKAN
jgi:predicted double-glycine peptidase